MAIAFGAYTNHGDNISFTGPTITGSDTYAFIVSQARYNSSQNPSITAITWGVQSMTMVASFSGTGGYRALSMWYVANPASGATVTQVGAVGNDYYEAHSLWYTSVTPALDSSATNNTASATSLTLTTTVVASGCWTIECLIENGSGNVAYTTNVGTMRLSPTGGGLAIADSNGTVGTGSQATTLTRASGSSGMNGIIASFAPAASTAIKTVDGLAYASVKTVNGLAVASVKTINGLA